MAIAFLGQFTDSIVFIGSSGILESGHEDLVVLKSEWGLTHV